MLEVKWILLQPQLMRHETDMHIMVLNNTQGSWWYGTHTENWIIIHKTF